MKLITINSSRDGQSAAILGDEILNFSSAVDASEHSVFRWVPSTVTGILEAGEEGLQVVDRLVKTVEDAGDAEKNRLRETGALTHYDSTPVLAPIPKPTMLLSNGGAYPSHNEEMFRVGALDKMPPPPTAPFGHFKNLNSVIGDRQPIILPTVAPAMVDWECEVSFVIGKTCHNVGADEAMDYVAGHTIMNDVSARDWVAEFKAGNPAPNMLGKLFHTFCPVGPCLVTKDEIPDPDDIVATLRLNGNVMQQESVANAYFSIPQIIAHFSQWLTFRPGDIISRGNPAGVGFAQDPQLFLKPGDVIEMEADGIGTMTNPVIAA